MANPMITDVDTALREIADWYVRNRREITEPELEAILLKHCEEEAEVRKFVKFLETEPGLLRFKTLLRERKEAGSSNPEKQFVKIGERVRYIGTKWGKYRREDWPKGAWMEPGVEGTVIEYYPGLPAIRIRGELIEEIRPWAVVKWNHGGQTAIDPEYEGKYWERIR